MMKLGMNDVFLANHVRGLVHKLHQRVCVRNPVVKDLGGVLRRAERDEAGGPVDLRKDGLAVDQRRQHILALLLAELEQFAHALRGDAREKLCHDAHIVLGHALLQVLDQFRRALAVQRGVRLQGGAVAGLEDAPRVDLARCHGRDQGLVVGHLLQLGLRLHARKEIRLLVVVGRENDEEHRVLDEAGPLVRAALDRRRLQQRAAVLADVKVAVVQARQLDHQAIVLALQVICGGILEEAHADLLADDLRPHNVAPRQAQAHLLEDELDFFTAVHGAKRLDLELVQDIGSGGNVALLLLNLGQLHRQPCTLDLHVNLARSDSPQRVEQPQSCLLVRRNFQVLACLLDHLRDRLLQLPAAL
eukprot:m.226584 g.226584  ORF g.226584 m.226584 type:complete len:360 (-) comp11444_c0_seq1:247-1326(-)